MNKKLISQMLITVYGDIPDVRNIWYMSLFTLVSLFTQFY